jgi:hypothetical protein
VPWRESIATDVNKNARRRIIQLSYDVTVLIQEVIVAPRATTHSKPTDPYNHELSARSELRERGAIESGRLYYSLRLYPR